MNKKFKLLLIVLFFAFLPFTGEAFSAGDAETFFVDSGYDRYGREKLDAKLILTTNNLYFYVDSFWWEGLSGSKKREYNDVLYNLGNAFEKEIHPGITSVFGKEPKHSVSKEERIFILFHEMVPGAGGYFNSADQYSVYQVKHSNQRNLLYISGGHLEDSLLPAYLAHEFMHLVTFARKNRERGVSEEVWLNEMRSEYVPTLLGYDDIYDNSNLQRRVNAFLRDPDISLTEWTNQGADYGIINLFVQYLVDHYTVDILVKSLYSEFTGIKSINYALSELGYDKTFEDVFTDWTVAIYVNDCSLNELYCYKNPNLSSVRVRPVTNFLPFTDKGSLTVSYSTKSWMGNWHRLVGGRGVLSLDFGAENGGKFKVPYILCNDDDECTVGLMDLNNKGEGSISISGFNTDYSSLTIIPSMQGKVSGFNGPESSYSFSWRAQITKEYIENETEQRLKELLEQLSVIKERLAYLRSRIAMQAAGELSCDRITSDLYLNTTNSREVACLQQFLKAQGLHIYPEGLVTGNFFQLTRNAVIRFQEFYKDEILSPLGLRSGTGYVGSSTRSFINSLIGQ